MVVPSLSYRASTLCVLICLIAMVIVNSAQALSVSVAVPGANINTPLNNIPCDVVPNSLAVKVVYCVKEAVYANTLVYLAQVSDLMRPIILAILTLALVIMGVRIASGERDPQKFSLEFLIKMGVVLTFADNFGASSFNLGLFGINLVSVTGGGFTAPVFKIVEELQAAVISSPLFDVLINGSGVCDFAGIEGNLITAAAGAAIQPIAFRPWTYVDCILDYIMGFGAQTAVSSSIFGFIGSAFFGGSVGVMVFFLGLVMVLMLLLFAFRCIYITLMAYIMIGFLIVLSPIFIPTLLFKDTENMFSKWWKNLVTAMMTPFIMIAYLTIVMPVIDQFVFDPDDTESLEYVLSNDRLGNPRNIDETFRHATPMAQSMFTQDMDFTKSIPDAPQKMFVDLLSPDQSGSNDLFGMLDFTKVDLGENHVKELWYIGLSLLRILVAVSLLLTIAAQIPNLTAYLVGAGYGFAAGASAPMLMETQVKGAMQQTIKSASSKAGSANGAFGGLTSMLRGG